jgi:hypothetical protein
MFFSHYIISNPRHARKQWSGTDSEDLFLRNKRTFEMYYPKLTKLKWRYANKKVTYNYNNVGFRINENINEDTDFSNAYAVFGCSFIEGIGNYLNETIPHYIEQKTGVKTYNFGLGGTGCDVVFFNVLKLMSFKKPPKKIFILWPEHARFSHYNLKLENGNPISDKSQKNITLFGIHTMNLKEFKQNYKPDYLVNSEILYSNKLVYMSRLRDLFGDILVELDVLEYSSRPELQDSSDNIAVNKSFGWNNVDEKYITDPNWIINNWFCRDIMINNSRLEQLKDVITDNQLVDFLKRSANGHWGQAKNKIIADLLISKMRGQL